MTPPQRLGNLLRPARACFVSWAFQTGNPSGRNRFNCHDIPFAAPLWAGLIVGSVIGFIVFKLLDFFIVPKD